MVLRPLLAIFAFALSSAVFAGSAAAADCSFCLDSVGLQTRDGQPWSAGQPVTLVVHVAGQGAIPLPSSGEAVVMQTDGDRTKCLGVPLKLVDSDTSGGLYAGLFFPFRPARYDGKLVIGGDVQDITFDVNQMVSGAAPAGDLPAAEPLDTSAPVPVPSAPQNLGAGIAAAASVSGAASLAAIAVCLTALAVFLGQRRRRQTG